MATREMTAVEDLMWCLGRLMGLAGTVRFDLPDEFRKELRETTIHPELIGNAE